MAIIRTENLHFTYQGDETETLHGVDLEIEEGSFVAILGHNGSGKSTLAKLFNGILLPTEGRVLVDGIDTAHEDKLIDVRRTIGLAPENLGVDPAEIRMRVDNALKTVGMYEYRLHAPHLLSGGQKQRVAIAGVLAMQPRCIVLDEPTAMLDPIGRREVVFTVTRLCREEGITVVLITHHTSECVGADRLVVMSEGRIIADGAPREVFSQVELLRGEGLSVPATTQLIYDLNKDGWDLPLAALTVDECADAVMAALR